MSACDKCGKDHDAIPFREAASCITGLDAETNERIWNRVDARLGGATHDEAVAMYPSPEREEGCPGVE